MSRRHERDEAIQNGLFQLEEDLSLEFEDNEREKRLDAEFNKEFQLYLTRESRAIDEEDGMQDDDWYDDDDWFYDRHFGMDRHIEDWYDPFELDSREDT